MIFESSWVHIFLQKWPKKLVIFWAIFFKKTDYKIKTAVAKFSETL